MFNTSVTPLPAPTREVCQQQHVFYDFLAGDKIDREPKFLTLTLSLFTLSVQGWKGW